MTIPAELEDRLARLSPEKRALVLQRLRDERVKAGGGGTLPIVSRSGRLPLSAAQRRLWMLAELEGPGATYNVASALRLSGALDVAMLETALRTLLMRHEPLRTTFHRGDDGLVEQRVRPVTDLRWWLGVEGLHGVDEGEALQRVEADARRSFTLTSDLPFRATLFRLAPERHLLLLVLHHLVTDGWSMNLLVEELGEAYSAALQGRQPSLAPLSAQYADYAAWERQTSDATGIDYWVDALRDAPTSLDLPTDRPRGPMATFRGDLAPFRLDAAAMRRLRAVGERVGASSFAVCLAAVSTTLARWTGQEDVLIGCPFANRTVGGTERMVGFFVNTLPVRLSHAGEPTFHDLVARAHGAVAGAVAHQSVPLERIVDALHVAREPGRPPLFQAAIAYQPAAPTLALPALRVEPLRIHTGTSKFELTVILDDGSDGCDGTIEFNSDLFDRASVERLARHICRFLDVALERPDTPIAELDLMPVDERLLLEQWAGATAPYPRDAAIPALLDGVASECPDRPAVVQDGSSMTYGELVTASRRVSGALRALGIGRGDTVAICAGRSVETVAAMAGILRAGAAYLPIDPSYPAPRIAFMLEDAGVDVVLTDGTAPPLPDGIRTIATDAAVASGEDSDGPLEVAATDAAYVMYTSGSTGEPKGVRIPHRAIVRLVCGTNFVPIAPRDVFLQLAPLTFDASTFEIWAPLLNGARLAIAPAGRLSVSEIGDALARHEVTTLWLTASFFNVVADERLEILAGLDYLLVGGDALSRPHVLRAARALPGTTLINGYGPTENTTFTCCHRIDASQDYATGIPIGRPIANTTAYILDAARRPCPIGVVGELYAGGDGLALGYEGQPDRTAERFVPNPFGAGRLYRTGDRARWLNSGDIEFLGRRDHQVKIRGFRVEPGEVEAAVLRVPGVRQTVVSVRRGAHGPELVAYVVGADPGDVSAALRTTLPEFLLPAAVVALEALPLTGNGKVDRAALPAVAHATDREFVTPATPTEAGIARLVGGLLGLDRVGATDRFFDLGGNSLVATQLVARIRVATGVELPLRAVFETSDIRGIAAAVDALATVHAGDARGVDLIPRVDRTSPLPLSFAQERLWFLQRLEPDNPFYNIAVQLRLTGALDVDALRLAIGDLVSRHEILRTRYIEVDGKPAQIIDSTVEIPLVQVPRGDIDGEGDVERRVRAEARAPFDLTAGPIVRTTLLHLADDRFVLLVTMHHIAADGWSMGVVVNELSAAYASRATTARPDDSAAPLAIQYADFACWQRARTDGDEVSRQLEYWSGQLAGFPAELSLPTDRPRPPVQSFRGGSVTFTIDASTTDRVAALSRDADATPFMVLLAAFATLLAQRAGQEDLVIGSPIANRTRAPLEPLIGFFVNTLALRVDLSGDPSFRELVLRVRQTALDGYAHQDVPFERVVQELQPERDLSRNPLFQVMFALQNAAVRPIDLPGLRVEPFELERTTAQFDLVLDMWERESGDLLGVLEFGTDLFDHATVRRMVDQLRALVAAAVASPDRPLSSLPRLSDGERRMVLDDFNANRAAFPVDRTLHGLFEAMVASGPDRCAAEHNGQVVRYDELNARANRIAHRLRAMGIGRNDFVGILLDRGLDALAAMLGTLKAGAAFVPIDPGYPASRVAYMLENSATRVVITNHARCDTVGAPTLVVDDPSLAAESSDNPPDRNAPTDRAYMLYTSGSTGLPKGAILRHDGKINHIYAQFRALAFHGGSAFLQTAPSSSDISVWQFLGPLLIGGRTIIVDHEVVCAPAELWTIIRESRATIIELVPVAMTALLEHAASLSESERDSTALEWAMATGEAVPPPLIDRWLELFPNVPIANAYGPTEAADDVCQHVLTRPLPAGARSVPIGTPLANLSMYVLDERLRLQPVGVPGQLAVSGIGVGEGYWRDPQRTRERFVPNPYAGQGRGDTLYLTGDIGYWRADGVLECLSRTDDQVKVRGFRIELGEIEATLAAHPAVRDAAVVAHGASDSRQLSAYVVPNAASADVAGELASMREEQIVLWKDLHEDEYRQTLDYGDPTFNVIGWDSSYTGQPLAREDMREYVDETVRRVLALRPRRLLEIGCGSGLLLFQLVPHLERYLGTDLSQVAIDRLEALRGDPAIRERVPALDRAQLVADRADAVDEAALGSIDTVIFPSVLQYFTGVDYLLTVLDRLIARIAPAATIYFGDVRSLPLLQHFHASVELFKADAETSAADLIHRIQARSTQEQEMTLEPAFFYALRERHPRISDVRILPKGGSRQNEMTCFRYDVVMRIGPVPAASTSVQWNHWPAGLTLDALAERLRTATDAIAFVDVPNARVARERVLARCLTATTTPTVAAIRAAIDGTPHAGVQPHELEQLGAGCGMDVHLSFARHDADGHFDVCFTPPGSAPPAFPEPQVSRAWARHANNPLHERLARVLTPRLREHLRARLAHYMVPTTIIVLPALPTTPAGKVDRAALPPPRASMLAAADLTPPRTDTERALADIWREVLGIDTCGARQNFFDLGGHSLKATRVVSRIRQRFGVDLPLRTLFERPTIEELARPIDEAAGAATTARIPRVPDAPDYPLSPAQRRLWILAQLDEGSVAYNMPTSLLVEGPLEVARLEAALATVVARHESLRTTFVTVGDEPRQRVWDAMPVTVSVADVSDARDPHAEALALAHRDAAQPFDLERGPLVRLSVVRMAADHHALLFNAHHMISDDWSAGILIRDFMRAYDGIALAPQRLQHRDIAAWQASQLESGGERHRAYWLQRLSGASSGLDLPADFPRPAVKTYRGETLHLRLDAPLCNAVRQLARREGSTLFMTLLAGVKALLFRYTGTTDIIVASPVAGREHPDIEEQIGFYVNTLALRDEVVPTQSFAELIAGVTRTTTEAIEHQSYPWDRLVGELGVRRDPSRMPVCDVTVVMANAAPYAFTLPGLAVGELVREYRSSKYDLHIVFDEGTDAIEVGFVYNPDLFTAPRIERMARHLRTLLRSAVADPSCAIGRLALMEAAERQQVLRGLDPAPGGQAATRTLHAWFRDTAAAHPHRTAIIDADAQRRAVSYADLDAASNRLAAALQSQGVRPGAFVGLFCDRSIEALTAMLGIVKAGAAYVPIDAAYPSERSSFILEDSGAAVVLTTAELRERLPATRAAVIEIEAALHTSAPYRPVAGAPDDVAYVIYTSGSTGRPKGVMVTHANVGRLFTATGHWFQFGPADVWSVFHSIAFDFSVWEIWGALLHGGCAVLVPHGHARSPQAFADLLAREAVTVLNQTPSAFRALMDETQHDGWRRAFALRHVIFGGEALDVRSLRPWFERYGDREPRLVNMYGITETTVHVTYRPLELADLDAGRSVIGGPIPDLAVYLLDARGEPVPIGIPGEICVGGAGVAAGYWNRDALNAERFVANPYGPGRLYKSGDLARRSADGDLEYLGRIDQQLKVRGFRIEPGEVEAALLSYADVRQALVMSRVSQASEPQLVAYAVGDVDPVALKRHVRERLPDYMVPAAIALVASLPLTAHGKIDRLALPDPFAGAHLGDEPPAGDVEAAIADAFAAMLGVERISATTNFFDAGADSLMLIRAHRALQARLGRAFPLVALYQHTTVRALAAFLADDETPAESTADADRRAARRRDARAQAAVRGRRG